MEMMSERLYWQPLSRTTQKSTVKHSPEYGELTQLAIWAKKLKGIPMSMWIKKTALLQSKYISLEHHQVGGWHESALDRNIRRHSKKRLIEKKRSVGSFVQIDKINSFFFISFFTWF